jgi:hypothetical protein
MCDSAQLPAAVATELSLQEIWFLMYQVFDGT